MYFRTRVQLPAPPPFFTSLGWAPASLPILAARPRSPSATALRRGLAAAGAYSSPLDRDSFLTPLGGPPLRSPPCCAPAVALVSTTRTPTTCLPRLRARAADRRPHTSAARC